MNQLPEHFSEPLRVKIASELIQKELRKLLLDVPQDIWPKADKNVLDWFEGSRSELAKVMDFWDGFDGILNGFKLKDISRFLTAANVSWHEEEIPIEQIIFTASLPVISSFGEPPFKAALLIDYLSSHADDREKIRLDIEKHSFPKRDHYNIICLKTGNGYKLLDGHRRAIGKILKGEEKIKAYSGTFGNSELPQNYWFPFQNLYSLLRFGEELFVEKNESYKKIDDGIIEIFSRHDNIKFLFPKRVKPKDAYKKQLYEKMKLEITEK